MEFTHLSKILIANRGEISCRIIKSCQSLNLVSIAIYSSADPGSLHAKLADEAYLLPGGDGTAYLDEEAILEIGRKSGASAVIPGYGFLSENEGFAKKVEEAGMIWVGPSSDSISKFGLKHTARELAVAAGVPVIKGTDLLESAEEAAKAAEDIGYPVMLKATAGGGGMGLQICHAPADIQSAFNSVAARGATLFKNTSMFMEKYVEKSRHVEVQVFGNGMGGAVPFGERECSIQRRHQKVVEECPSPFVQRDAEAVPSKNSMRQRLVKCASELAASVNYGSAGTVEFLVDDTTGDFYFLEMNTRLQVEHGITELCYGVDLVSLMLQQAEYQARGEGGIPMDYLVTLPKAKPNGYAIECRVYAEVPSRNFAPSPGLLQLIDWHNEPGVRVDTWVTSGTNISPFYDPMIAKVMVWDETHDGAVRKMSTTLAKSKIQGCPTNIQYLEAIIASPDFASGNTTTAFLSPENFKFTPITLDVISGGAYTTIQDLPARQGIGNGVPESGPMDPVSFRLANIIVGNEENVEGMEITLSGPELLFHVAAQVAITGGGVGITLNGQPVDMYTRLLIPAGGKLKIGPLKSGCRSYLAIRGGFPSIPPYLGSKSTTSTLKLGGFQGRHLLPSDSIDLDKQSEVWAQKYTPFSVPKEKRLDGIWKKDWELCVMAGPHDDEEMITEGDRTTLYTTPWKVTHDASRSGYRLKGPRLTWAKTDGGEGGSHPGNVIDEPYSYGGLNWNGDDPVLLPVDGPMAGGLATTCTVVRADFWRLGQCRPGDTIRFKRVTWDSALELRKRTEKYIASIKSLVEGKFQESEVQVVDTELADDFTDTILHEMDVETAGGSIQVRFRQAGDCHIHVTYGPMTANVLVRAHIQHRLNRLNDGTVPGVVAVIGCTRSYCVQFNSLETHQQTLLRSLISLETSLGSSTAPLPSRLFRFPILLDDPACKAAVADYMATVRDSATYLPDNMEYIARANGVDNQTATQSIVGCKQIVTEVSFLGGTPLMLPLDPRLRYVAQKYNPVRNFTAEGTVGLGGPLVVIYPMDAPGGYQLWGRTIAPWDAYASKPHFDHPWLLREFDQLQFYEVDKEEFDRCYELFKIGRWRFEVEETEFDPVEYGTFLKGIENETKEFFRTRNEAGRIVSEEEAVMSREWREKQGAKVAVDAATGDDAGTLCLRSTAYGSGEMINVIAPMTASVWKIQVSLGDVVVAGQTLAILEAMKMEIPIRPEEEMVGKTVAKITSPPGTLLDPGQVILALKA